MQILVLSETQLYSIRLPAAVSGQYCIYAEDRKVAVMSAYKGKWHLCAEDGLVINRIYTQLYVRKDETYLFTENGKAVIMLLIRDAKSYTYKKYDVCQDITIGRSPSCTIVYPDPYISACHAVLHYEQGAYVLEDQSSTNHVYVNRRRFQHGTLRIGDVVEIMELQIVIGKGFLVVNDAADITIAQEIKMHHPVYIKPAHVRLPVYVPSFRKQASYMPACIEVKAMEEVHHEDEILSILRMGPSFMVGMVSLMNAVLMFQNGSSSMAAMSISMFVGMILFPVLTHIYQKRKIIKERRRIQEEYDIYFQKIIGMTEDEKKRERAYFLYAFPSLQTMWTKKIYWYRTVQDPYFLVIRFAVENRSSLLVIHNESNRDIPVQICDVPVTLDLKKEYLISVSGGREDLRTMLLNMLLQVAFSHSYKNVRVAYIGKEDLSFIRWLPHMRGDGLRGYFDDEKAIIEFHRSLEEKLTKENAITPPVVLFLWIEDLAVVEGFLSFILQKPYMGVTVFVFSFHTVAGCHVSVDLVQKEYRRRYEEKKGTFQCDTVNNVTKMIHFLANCRTQDFRMFAFPRMCSLLSLYRVRFVEELHIWNRWEKHQSYHSLKVPVGIQKDGSVLSLDIHEKKDGPHGIIAGMTGSGKSECILTYLVSMAISFHPRDVSFIIIDYKGGGIAKLLEALPHVAGVLTNLDDKLLERAFEALSFEARKRQMLLKDAGLRYQIANIGIDDYQRLYYEKKVAEPLSHILIVCDEFAELKMQHPMYMEQLISIARIGRSLGIHLILATQKPSGIVNDQIWSNTNFHLCLRVAEKADSFDVIKHPDAAFLTSSGQFYLQNGNEERLILGLSAWAQAVYDPEEIPFSFDKICAVSHTGKTEQEVSLNDIGFHVQNRRTQLEVILRHIQTCAKQNDIHSRLCWLPPLSFSKSLPELEQSYGIKKGYALIGEIDDIFRQCYCGFYLSLRKNSILYGTHHPSSFIAAVLSAYIRTCPADGFDLYIIDMAEDFFPMVRDCDIAEKIIRGSEIKRIKVLFQKLLDRCKGLKKEEVEYSYVIIYGYTLFESACMEQKEAMHYMLKEGDASRIHFLITTYHERDISYHIKDLFSEHYMLDGSSKECTKGSFQNKHVYDFCVAKPDEEIIRMKG